AAMMLEYFNLLEEGRTIREAVQASMDTGIVTADLAGDKKAYSTSEVGEWICNHIAVSH
ncbi:MAG: 3-isopropylmalate dehydrogenase, partial [Paludibacteraceae bacterium]|nr:3-isopropylmalate dehydrogenase [Paludibacteraceae bacterium]